MKLIFTSLALLLLSLPSFAVTHENKNVLTIYSPEENRACTLFQLNDVSTADPSNPNKPWFGVSTDHPGHEVIVSMLLTALSSNKTVNVVTTGQVNSVCGHSGVNAVFFHY